MGFLSNGVCVLLRAGGLISPRNILVLRNFGSTGILPVVKKKVSVVYIYRKHIFYEHIILK